MQAWKSENMSAEEALDVLLTTVREGNLEAEQLAGSLGRVMGIAATMGVTFAEVGGFIATFTRLGVSAEIAATSLRATLAAILNPTDKTRDALAELGMTADDLRRRVGSQGLTRTMIDLIRSAEGNFDAIGNLIPNIRALSGVLGTAGVQADAYLEITDNITNSSGELVQAFERVRETPAQSLSELKAEVETLFIAFGTELLPILNDTIDVLSRMVELAQLGVDAFGSLPAPIRRTAVALGLLGAALAPILAMMGVLTPMMGAAASRMIFMNMATLRAAVAVQTFGRGVATAMPFIGVVVAVLAGMVTWINFVKRGMSDALGPIREYSDGLDDVAESAEEAAAQLRALSQEQLTRQTNLLTSEYKSLEQQIHLVKRALDEAKRTNEAQLNPVNDQTQSAAKLEEALGILEERYAAVGSQLNEIAQMWLEQQDLTDGVAASAGEVNEAYEALVGSLEQTVIRAVLGEEALLRFRLAQMKIVEGSAEFERALMLHRWGELPGVVEEAVGALETYWEFFRKWGAGTDEDKSLLSDERTAEVEARLERVRIAMQVSEASAQRMSASFGDAAAAIVTDFGKIGEAMGRLVDELLAEFGRLAARATIIGPLQEFFGNLLGGFAGGGSGIPQVTGVQPPSVAVDLGLTGGYARGGRIPTGRFGLVGELGPEIVGGPANVTPVVPGVTVQQHITFSPNFIDGASGRAWLETEGRPAIQAVMRESLQDSRMASRAVQKGRM
jgi:hypothetical protein